MAILFPVKSEMAILFFVKRDPGPPFTTLFNRDLIEFLHYSLFQIIKQMQPAKIY